MGREKIELGRKGEDLAMRFLRERGYKLLATNFRTVFGEIDAVAKFKDKIVFVEVKTRSSSSFGPPFLAITWAKKRHIIKNAYAYLKMRGLTGSDWRIDIVSVRLNVSGTLQDIELIENAVEET